MIFVGDIASPTREIADNLKKELSNLDYIFFNQRIICNFEGLISDNSYSTNKPVLWNHPSVPEILIRDKVPVLCLANNHSLDIPEKFGDTVKIFHKNKVHYCGAGFSFAEAEKPVIFTEGKCNIAVFNFCWDFLLYNTDNPLDGIYIATIDEKKIVNRIKNYKESNPDIYIVVYLHWNLDLEILPFPVNRQFAKDLINAGANIVVGSHSHCVQGGERYNGGYIVYGLGNFFIPNGYFAKGKIYYPDIAAIELGLEWDPLTNEAKCHWFDYRKLNGEHKLRHIVSEKFDQSEILAKYTQYAGMNHEEYIRYYKKYRRKKFLIPIYTDYRKESLVRFYNMFLKKRARTAHIMARLNIIRWQN